MWCLPVYQFLSQDILVSLYCGARNINALHIIMMHIWIKVQNVKMLQNKCKCILLLFVGRSLRYFLLIKCMNYTVILGFFFDFFELLFFNDQIAYIFNELKKRILYTSLNLFRIFSNTCRVKRLQTAQIYATPFYNVL